MPAEEKLKHLEFIQSVISRMSANSFFLKGWGVTLATKDTSRKYVVVGPDFLDRRRLFPFSRAAL